MNGMMAQPSPHDVLGWMVVVIGAITTIATIVASVYWTVRPGENDPQHPKRLVLKDDR